MTLAVWLGFLLAAILIAVTPGPGAVISMSTGMRHGYWAALTAILAATFAGFFAYKHVAYDSSLWWQFSLRGDAPRFLRGLFGIAVLLAGLALKRRLSSAP